MTWVFFKPPIDFCEKMLVSMLPKLTLVLKILNICYRFTETIYFHRSGDYSISLYISSLHIIIESIAFVHNTHSLKLQFYQAVSYIIIVMNDIDITVVIPGFVHGSLEFKSSSMLVKSQLVCLRPVGILNSD